MNVDSIRVVKWTDLLQDLFCYIPCESFPVFVATVKDVMKFESRLKLFELFSQYDVLLFLVSEQENQIDVLVFHADDFFDDLVAWCDAAASRNEENSFGGWCKFVGDDNSMRLIVKFSERSLNVDDVSDITCFKPSCDFSSIGEFRVNIGPVYLEQNINCVSLRTWWDWGVFMWKNFALWMIPCLDVFNDFKVLPDL